MKTKFKLLTLSLAAAAVVACGQKNEKPFEFTVLAESVEEGNPLPVSVTITSGATSGYAMSSGVYAYDMSTSQASITDYILKSGEMPADGGLVSFEDHGKRDFHVDGLPAGTYMVSVQLSKDGLTAKNSVVAVVHKKNGGDIDPPTPPVDIPVSSFVLTGLDLTDGVLILDPGQERRYGLSWTPSDATDPEFDVTVSRGGVVDAYMSGNFLVVKAVAAGETVLTVSEKGGVEKTFPIKVRRTNVAIESFEIGGLDLTEDWLELEDNAEKSYSVTWRPADATKTDFVVTSSNESVVSASYADGTLRIYALYPGTASVTVTAPDGPTKVIPVRVYKNVKVTVEWEELTATDTQINTKTFPCYLVFSSDSDKAFPEPITWGVTMKGVVNVTGRDTKSVVSKQDVKFYGNRRAQYDVTSSVLIPCYSIYRTTAFTLSVTLSLQRSGSLDPKLWRVTYDEKFKTQEARIKQYLTDIQQ